MRYGLIIIAGLIALTGLFLWRSSYTAEDSRLIEGFKIAEAELSARYEKLPVAAFPCHDKAVPIRDCLLDYLATVAEGKGQLAEAALAEHRQVEKTEMCPGWGNRKLTSLAVRALEGEVELIVESVSKAPALKKGEVAAEVVGQLIRKNSDNLAVAERLWPYALRDCVHLTEYGELLSEIKNIQVNYGGQGGSYAECIGALICRCGGQFGFC